MLDSRAAILRDLHRMEKWVESNFRKFSQDKMKSFTWERRILCNSPGCGLIG